MSSAAHGPAPASAQAPAGDGGDGGAGPGLKRAITPALLLLFIVGDILGTGVYALTGKVAGKVGGVVWLPFLLAFLVAMLTACSYLELVTKYPRAGGAAAYTHRAFKVHFLTFITAFLVMASGLTSASSAAKSFAANLREATSLDIAKDGTGILLIALGFILLVALVNLRGVSEAVWVNVVLTCIELSGLLIIILIGLWALAQGDGDASRLTEFKGGDTLGGKFTAVTSATALAFFAMVGFEDSVNMAEETKDPVRTFPKMLLLGLGLTGVIYLLVSISAITLVDPDRLSQGNTPLLHVIEAGAPGFPVEIFATITVFAVANTALINMMMASRLLYGMAHERVLPPVLGRILAGARTPYVAIAFTTLLAVGLIYFADLQSLGATTSLLLLVVFTVVNVAVLVLRSDDAGHAHFRAPTLVPVVGAATAAFLASPLSSRDTHEYVIAGWLLLTGVVLWAVYFLYRRLTHQEEHEIDVTAFAGDDLD